MFLPVVALRTPQINDLKPALAQFKVPAFDLLFDEQPVWWLKQPTNAKDLLQTPVGQLYYHWTGANDAQYYQMLLDGHTIALIDHQLQTQLPFNDVTMTVGNHLIEWRLNQHFDQILLQLDPNNGIIFIKDDQTAALKLIPPLLQRVYLQAVGIDPK